MFPSQYSWETCEAARKRKAGRKRERQKKGARKHLIGGVIQFSWPQPRAWMAGQSTLSLVCGRGHLLVVQLPTYGCISISPPCLNFFDWPELYMVQVHTLEELLAAVPALHSNNPHPLAFSPM
jgi:hypothetical protein